MRIAICGIGRAGKTLVKKVLKSTQYELVLVINRNESIFIGNDVGEVLGMVNLGIPIVSVADCEKELVERNVDVVIDFSNKAMTMQMVRICEKTGTNYVICTTDFTEKELFLIEDIGREGKIGIVYAPNLTLGINLLIEFVSKLSKILPDFDFEIIERHCRDKKIPSHTAKVISNVIDRGDTKISSIRAGGYVGVHEVTAANQNERITIVHESFSRDAFAAGALLATDFVYQKKGIFLMHDVIKEMENAVL